MKFGVLLPRGSNAGVESGILFRVESMIRRFSFVEKVFFCFFVLLLLVALVLLLIRINNVFLVETPLRGGNFTEGVVGAPRFINPLLAISDTDRDITMLVYSGLMKATPEGELIFDAAERYVISEDGLSYTFTLRNDAVFHDSEKITAEDVVYTVLLAQDSTLKSTKRANWEGVFVEALDEKTVRFTLARPYSLFLENTTLGIMPKHIWENTPVEQHAFSTFNIEPVGSGPYKISDVSRSSDGIPTRYSLKSFSRYALGEPYITDIAIKFYDNEDSLVSALRKGSVDNASAISPMHAEELSGRNLRVETFPLPRVFGVFLNQDEASLFTNREVRVALNASLDRSLIVDEVLYGYGTPILGPFPPQFAVETPEEDLQPDFTRAKNILENNNWEFDEEFGALVKETDDQDYLLSFTIRTANTPELKETAELVKSMWENIGARVTVELFDTGNLNNEVIRPREYGALLFGQVLGRNLDPFAFWHSSQRNDPGLNVALYASITADNVLEEIRTTFDREERDELYKAFEAEVLEDVPAIFLYSPDFVYVVKENIKGFEPGTANTSAERFLNVHEWHTKTDRVWEIFQEIES